MITMPATPFEHNDVRGFLHPGEGKGGLVLTHGAGGDATSHLLVAVAEAFAASGVTVLRYDLPFRIRRPKGPPSPGGSAADRQGLAAAVAALRETVAGPLYLGGQSYGGRQALMLAADDPKVADALLLLSYPLHPPGKPDRMRTDHFSRLRVPCVFVHGTKDGFASSEELRQAAGLIGPPTRVVTIEGAGHDLKRGKFEIAPMVDALTLLAEPV